MQGMCNIGSACAADDCRDVASRRLSPREVSWQATVRTAAGRGLQTTCGRPRAGRRTSQPRRRFAAGRVRAGRADRLRLPQPSRQRRRSREVRPWNRDDRRRRRPGALRRSTARRQRKCVRYPQNDDGQTNRRGSAPARAALTTHQSLFETETAPSRFAPPTTHRPRNVII